MKYAHTFNIFIDILSLNYLRYKLNDCSIHLNVIRARIRNLLQKFHTVQSAKIA